MVRRAAVYRGVVGLRPPPDGPAGWYPSLLGAGIFRLWDGERWSSGTWQPDDAARTPEQLVAGYPVQAGDVRIGTTQAERIAARAEVLRDGVEYMELRALDGDPTFDDAVWVRGHLVYWWRPEIDRLKRESRLGEALELAWECMEAVEHQRPLPPAWAWDVAVIARKMRRYNLEVEVLERVLALAAAGATPPEQWEARLVKARQLAART